MTLHSIHYDSTRLIQIHITLLIPYQLLKFNPLINHISDHHHPNESGVSSHINHVFLWFQPIHSFHMTISYSTRHTQLMHHANHTSCSIIYMSIITRSYSTKTDHSGKFKYPKRSTVSPSISLRLTGLAQARRARSGEPPSRLGESTKAGVWASRDLA